MGLNGDPSAFPTTFATLSDLLDPTPFAAVVADRRFAVAAAIALVSGAARGFSGFGSAMIYIPLVAAVYERRTAAATMVQIDLVCAFPLAVRAVPHCSWREVTPIDRGRGSRADRHVGAAGGRPGHASVGSLPAW
jgi:hypothetical protein